MPEVGRMGKTTGGCLFSVRDNGNVLGLDSGSACSTL